jgi:tRNA pseudouridine38-40 synthase
MVVALSQRRKDVRSCGGADSPAAQGVRLALVIEYNGARYAGSQMQSDVATVQSELQNALLTLTGEEIRTSMAGRTDAGVHAYGQVASFKTASCLPVHAFVSGLNHFLPADISVKSAKAVEDSFDPRRHAFKREYEYFILNSNTRSALWKGRACQVAGVLDAGAMHRACKLLLGEHDFASFTPAVEEPEKTTVRRMYEAAVRREGDIVTVKLVASAFLAHQVRNTVGALIRVGQGKMTQDDFQGIINVREFGLVGPSVPACGLYLNRVYYGDSLEEGF